MLKEQEINLISLIDRYHGEDKCRARLEELRWPDGVECIRCDSKRIARLKNRTQYQCNSCRYHFSVTAGSIFHDSHLPLTKWFAAIFLICESRKGMSANQLKRTLKESMAGRSIRATLYSAELNPAASKWKSKSRCKLSNV